MANGFLKYGYEVKRGTRNPDKLAEWTEQAGPSASVGTFPETAAWGDAVVLAVKGTMAEAIVARCGAALAGKTVMDATNPIADEAPEDGVLRYFTDINESLMERMQNSMPEARFVKVFSCVGNAFMIDPDFDGIKPTMFICGDDDAAKGTVKGVLEQFGWEFEDMGTAKAARAIEPLAMLWCIPGFRSNAWNHVFKLLKT